MQSRRSGDQDNPIVPLHHRMRAFDRDLIRGGHYGRRSCEPHLKAEHMAAPTKPANVKNALANLEPSTHGTLRHFVATPDVGRTKATSSCRQRTFVRPLGGKRFIVRSTTLGPRSAIGQRSFRSRTLAPGTSANR